MDSSDYPKKPLNIIQMKAPNNFAIFVMTYGRKDKVPSVESLRKSNYSGKWFLVVGDDDPQLANYQKNFGDKVLVFDKDKYYNSTERIGLDIKKVICFARNACFDLAQEVGVEYFQQFDDDYTGFHMTYDADLNYLNKRPILKDYDRVVINMLEFYKNTPFTAIAFSQGGDFIGGGDEKSFVKRKCMNSWICSTKRPFRFQGSMNEDTNAYTFLASQGHSFVHFTPYRLEQPVTQSSGGMTEVYKKYGTHVKSFLTVILNPSFVKIGQIKSSDGRLHHSINWERCAAKIISEEYKK